MILYNTAYIQHLRYAPSYPAWVKCEHYEQCESFIGDFAALETRSDFGLLRKAGAFVKALGRRGEARNNAGDAEAALKCR